MKSNIFWEKWGKAQPRIFRNAVGLKCLELPHFFDWFFFNVMNISLFPPEASTSSRKKWFHFFWQTSSQNYRLKLSYNNLENFHQLFNTGILTKAISLTRLCAFDKNPKTLTRFYYSDVGFYIKSKNFDCTVQCTLYISPIL